MQITARAFNKRHDRSWLAEFIMLAYQLAPETGYVHLGDVLRNLWHNYCTQCYVLYRAVCDLPIQYGRL